MPIYIAQTFTIDPAAVNLSDQVNITSIDVYFRAKPFGVGNQSGTLDPGITVYIVPTAAGGIPNYNTLDDYTSARKEFSEIVSSRDATVATNFKFQSPVPVRTGIEYAIVVKPDNQEGYELWAATEGEINVATNSDSSGIAGKYTGKYFELSGTAVNWQPLPYKNLKFKVYVGRYAYNGVIPAGHYPKFTLNMKNYEFVTFNNKIGSFFNGEYVYQKKNISDGIVSIIQGQNIATTSGGGFSGLFSPRGDDSYIVVEDGTNHCVRKVISVSNDNNTIIVDIPFSFTSSSANFTRTAVAKAYLTKNSQIVSGSDTFIVLTDSAANSTVFFSNNSVLIGEISGTTISNAYFNDILVHSTEPHVYVHTPSQTTFTSREIFGYTSSDDINGVLSSPEMSFNVSMYSPTNLDTGGQPVMLKSRSNEVVLQNWSSSVKSKSSRLEYDIVTTNDWSSPQIDYNSTDVFFNRFIINNDASNENTLNGNAISKHITTKVNFAREAEDILVYLQAYKPPHTDIKVYAKLYNSKDTDYFVDKDWTELVEASGSRTSSISNLQDFVEYTYGLKTSPPVDMPIPGVCHVTADSSTVTGVGVNYTSYLAGGDLIKIYPNLFPQNYVIYSVYNVANATSIVLNTPVSSSDVASLGNQVSSYPTTVPIIANTSGIDYINNVLLIDNSNNTFKYGDKVEYIIKSTQKPIPTLTGNREYYVSFANNSAVALSVNYGGSNVDLGTNINANTSGVNNTSGMIYINNANAYYSVGDRVYYSVPAGNTAISGLVANNNYFVTYSDNTGIVVATSLGAANATITESRTGTAEVHQFIINNAIAAKQVLSTSVNGLVIQKLEEPHQAFINTRNNNTVRYFNSSMTIFDKYDTFALKVVMLSDSQFIIPKISNIRAVGVSA